MGREMEKLELRDVKDSLDSLHQRMDRFYAWAAQLQVEMRNVHQRLGFLEQGLHFNQEPSGGPKAQPVEETEESILERINRFKRHSC